MGDKRILRLLAVLLALCLLPGCNLRKPPSYTQTYLDLFDTVTTVKGYADSPEAFQAQAEEVYGTLLRYHQLFDIYHSYEEIPNLKTVNDAAGIGPVKVDPDIIRLLLDCKAYFLLTGGRVNAAMGSVLRLWHNGREEGQLPDPEVLSKAAEHTAFDAVIINEKASTVYITDPELSLDVGAIAKGWAAQRAAEQAPEGWLISVGGNVCLTGPKPSGDPWRIGIQDPDGGGYLHTLRLSSGSAVTSGDYQRTFTVGGKSYHHIIDPDTRMPSELWRSVTVIAEDSALADALSTALFLLPQKEGQTLAEAWGAEVFWLAHDGAEYMTPGFPELLAD